MIARAFFLVVFAVGLIAEEPFIESELVFPPEHWHCHASCVVEAANGDLLVCWFQGSGERKSDDVKIEGARLKKGAKQWSKRFVMADTLEYPDTNCSMFVDPQGRLWLIWPTILANTWESALLKVKIATDWNGEGVPKWEKEDVIHITPKENFGKDVTAWLDDLEKHPILNSVDEDGRRGRAWLTHMRSYSTNKLNQRLGWMTRAHPFVLDGKRLIVPLYSDGFSFSLMAITDDWGINWRTSNPLLGLGNIQPSIVKRNDGSLYTLMRDNGPPPKRLLQSESRDGGETWSKVTDSEHPNPGAGAEITRLANGHWILISNDTERGRNRIAVEISPDEGKTWPWKRYLEKTEETYNSFHYPSIMQARDGSIHATWSHHLGGPNVPKDVDGDPASKSIKHARFNEAWITNAPKTSAAFPLLRDDVVAFIGGADVASAQHTAHLEALLTSKFPGAKFRNFGWEGDTVFEQRRDFKFPSLKEHLTQAGATVIVIQFGRMESMNGDLPKFEEAYAKLINEFSQITPRLVLVTPPGFEKASDPLPDLTPHNNAVEKYASAIRRLAESKKLQVIDLFQQLRDEKNLTSDGLQFTERGHAAIAMAFAREAGAYRADAWTNPVIEELRQQIKAKNRLWFDYWRPQNWAFLGGDRTEQPSSRDHRDPKVRWFPEEMKRFTSLIGEAENKIEAAAHAIH